MMRRCRKVCVGTLLVLLRGQITSVCHQIGDLGPTVLEVDERCPERQSRKFIGMETGYRKRRWMGGMRRGMGGL
jgi:hypothetical protein